MSKRQAPLEKAETRSSSPPVRLGRPPKVERLDYPDDLLQSLMDAGFFNPEESPHIVMKNLPDASRFSTLDRLRAATERLLELTERDNIDQTLGRSWKSFQRYLLGQKLPSDVMAALCRTTGITPDWLLFGRPPELGESAILGDFALLPRYEVRASAGQGLVAVSEDVAETLAFRRDWLSRLGINPQNAGLVTAEGDSMAPTVPDGAIMLVDLSIRDVRNGMIYVMARDGAVIVKRVQIRAADGAIVLISDNPAYERETVSRDQLVDLHIAGRVVWAGHSV